MRTRPARRRMASVRPESAKPACCRNRGKRCSRSRAARVWLSPGLTFAGVVGLIWAV